MVLGFHGLCVLIGGGVLKLRRRKKGLVHVEVIDRI